MRGDAWTAEPTTSVDQIMEPGPTTVRPDTSLHDLIGRMEKRGTRLVAVADPQGHLIGALVFDEAARLVSGEAPERIWCDCEGCPGRWAPTPVA